MAGNYNGLLPLDYYAHSSVLGFDADGSVGILDRILDFTQGQDQLDLHLITSLGQAPTTLVRAIEDASNSFAIVEVDPDGFGGSSAWVPVAQLDGLHAGDL